MAGTNNRTAISFKYNEEQRSMMLNDFIAWMELHGMESSLDRDSITAVVTVEEQPTDVSEIRAALTGSIGFTPAHIITDCDMLPKGARRIA